MSRLMLRASVRYISRLADRDVRSRDLFASGGKRTIDDTSKLADSIGPSAFSRSSTPTREVRKALV
jgi:hypothetical protein